MTSRLNDIRARRTITPAVALHYIESLQTWHSPAEPEVNFNQRTSIGLKATPYRQISKGSPFGDEIQEGRQKGTTSSHIGSTNTDLSTSSKKIVFGYTWQSTKLISGTLSNQYH